MLRLGSSLSALLASAALLAPAGAVVPAEPGFGPSKEAAVQNAPAVFNAVNDAMRQWGSSLHHNGMSFFLATVPEGVVLHHGNDRKESPVDPDWLAYEIEHATHFARPRGRGPPGSPGGPGGRPGGPGDDRRPPDDTQHVLSGRTDDSEGKGKHRSHPPPESRHRDTDGHHGPREPHRREPHHRETDDHHGPSESHRGTDGHHGPPESHRGSDGHHRPPPEAHRGSGHHGPPPPDSHHDSADRHHGPPPPGPEYHHGPPPPGPQGHPHGPPPPGPPPEGPPPSGSHHHGPPPPGPPEGPPADGSRHHGPPPPGHHGPPPDWPHHDPHDPHAPHGPPHGPPPPGPPGPPPPPPEGPPRDPHDPHSPPPPGPPPDGPPPHGPDGHRPPPPGPPPEDPPQDPPTNETAPTNGASDDQHGWLHTYRTTRALRYLYVDGMGGGKTSMGTLDSQDLLLRGQSAEEVVRVQREHEERHRQHMRMTEAERKAERKAGDKGRRRGASGPMDEQERAKDMCQMCKEWGLSGIVRMEAGFEIIHCDFSDGLEEIQVMRRPVSTDGPGGRGRNGPGGRSPGGPPGMNSLEFLRGLAARYDGIGSQRTVIDYASMVSAFFFPVNLTNPDASRPDLPRLLGASTGELAAVRRYLDGVVAARKTVTARSVDWQAVADIVVARYAERLQYMAAASTSADVVAREIDFLLDVYIDYDDDNKVDLAAAEDRCTHFYLHAFAPTTEADGLLYAAFEAVTGEICQSLLRVRAALKPQPDSHTALREAKVTLGDLLAYLGWAQFKRCGGCNLDEACLVPMWPMGSVEDYRAPRCSNGSSGEGESYWGDFGGPGRGRPNV